MFLFSFLQPSETKRLALRLIPGLLRFAPRMKDSSLGLYQTVFPSGCDSRHLISSGLNNFLVPDGIVSRARGLC